ncbi:carbohydrate kinase [Flavobacterium zepuense]|uniref:Carbohydrate kinase n=1 Tax=Flavobacterium zepuense TaxID=2593302 RepID=A0A552V9T6_9FLAO|nr:carbohydrate kinase [Flavobacterium zepuense]TRW27232.1 carbohydrate kinase [Flavobacterium zepuense]
MNTGKKLKAVSYGEVLWDVFANGKKIGGAPLNLALRMQSLGCDVAMISCVGNDSDGEEIVDYVKAQGLDTGGIIRTEDYPTGLVQVYVNDRGSASYEISYPSAWDKIQLTDYARSLVADADVLIYGSLVCRDRVSKKSLEELLLNNVYKVFDVNLRPPHYTQAAIENLMGSANFIKFNDEELLEIATGMGSPHTLLEDNMEFIATKTKTRSMCVTKGKHGAILMWESSLYNNNGYPVKVVDTVGAGDSFLATLIMGLLTGENPQHAIDYACAVGALVAASAGANPILTEEKIQALMHSVE